MSYNLLKGKRGIIFGALNEQSIAWKVAEKAVEEGAIITLSNTPVAVRMGEVSALAEKLNCEIIPADATSVEDLENVFKRSMEVLAVRSTLYCILSVCHQTYVRNVLMMTWIMIC
jgi:enoyl-[acyl-carrier protein] reductase I